jgi:hypothetical protein
VKAAHERSNIAEAGSVNRLKSIASEFELDVLAERHVESPKLAAEPKTIFPEALL